MQILKLEQGSPEWNAHRAKSRNASEAAAMLGLSKRQTRNELLRQKATGDSKTVSAETQMLFDRGHASEAAATRNVEALIDDTLYPATATDNDGYLSASFDGITADESTTWENKLYNNELATYINANNDLPDTHWPQVEQGFLVSGAQRCIFTLCDEDGNIEAQLEYLPRIDRQHRIIAGWKQFQADLANYQHTEVVAVPVAANIEALPALVVQLEGKVVSSNLTAFKESALTFIKGINTDLQTDQHFADADQMVKFCKDGEDRLELVKSQALAQTASIDELFRTIDTISAELRAKRLELDRLVKARKETIRGDIVQGGGKALAEHIAALNARLGKPYMPTIAADFPGVVKNKRTPLITLMS